jgi:SAM-dependent methyltransferase
MINYDDEKNTFFPQVDFKRKNVETEFEDVAEYDVVVCLFGLHWMNDLESTLGKIHRSLKAGGLLLSLTPIEIHDLFDFRTAFVNNSTWTVAIAEEARTLHPFHYEKEDYLKPLSKYFKTNYEEKKETKFNYTHDEFKKFLHSWFQEVRHLTNDVSHEIKKEAIANAFISDFINSIPKNLNGNVVIHEDGSIIYTQHTFDFDGEKIDL